MSFVAARTGTSSYDVAHATDNAVLISILLMPFISFGNALAAISFLAEI